MHRIVEGLMILVKYEPDSDLSIHNDSIYFADYKATMEVMSEEDKLKLEELGWSEDEESWFAFT
jgi:hypothetical protein